MPQMASLGERKVASILTAAGLDFQQEYEFPDLIASSGRPLRLDFVVFDDDGEILFAIEFQGEQHYKPVKHFGGGSAVSRQKFNDRKKAQYCLDHCIPLVVIPYYDYDILDYDYIITKANFC